jgi:hypothetical protein
MVLPTSLPHFYYVPFLVNSTCKVPSRPAHVKIEDKMVQVCAGGMHTVCLTNQGKVSYGLVMFYLGLTLYQAL